MSLIKQWIIDQERKMDEDLMFFDADCHYYLEQAMQEECDEPGTSEEAPSEPKSNVPF
tara:strand:+ start:12038 stop:12211 length:174 start_codon:yes stop_codon:yes gene_type:complete